MGEVGGGGGNKGQCERWGLKGGWTGGVLGGLGERWVDGNGEKCNRQNAVVLRCANNQ